MLNPSTADDTRDDPTIRRCVAFSKAWGYPGLIVVNLYALRATNPTQLWTAADPIGPRNDTTLQEVMDTASGKVVAAWGAHARPTRVARLRDLTTVPMWCLGTTKAGAPRHPLYVSGHATLKLWMPDLSRPPT
jgi:hypothetical protein